MVIHVLWRQPCLGMHPNPVVSGSDFLGSFPTQWYRIFKNSHLGSSRRNTASSTSAEPQPSVQIFERSLDGCHRVTCVPRYASMTGWRSQVLVPFFLDYSAMLAQALCFWSWGRSAYTENVLLVKAQCHRSELVSWSPREIKLSDIS